MGDDWSWEGPIGSCSVIMQKDTQVARLGLLP